MGQNFEQSLKQQLQDAPQTLTPEQQAAYRKASRLCHPDKLADEFKVLGTAFFKALNEAYRRQDLQRVLDILHSLETGVTLSTASDSITDKPILHALRERIAALEADETYLCMQTITSKDDCFSEL